MSRLRAAAALLLLAPASPAWSQTAAADGSPLFVDEVVEVVREETLSILETGLQSVLVVDPAVANAQVDLSAGVILVRGLSFGDTYLHIWTEQGRKTVQVRVISPLKKRERELALKKKKDYQVTQSLSSNVRRSRFGEKEDLEKYQETTYGLEMAGPTAWGENRSRLRYFETRDGRKGLTTANVQFKNRAGAFEAGDTYADFSRLTMSGFSFQGAHWASPAAKPAGLNLLAGYRNKELFGDKVSLSGDRPAEPFVGLKAEARPGLGTSFFASATKSVGGWEGGPVRNAGLGGRVEAGALGFQAEAAASDHGKAWYGDLDLRKGKAFAVLSHRDVDSDYLTVTGGSWERGRLGQAVQAGLNPSALVEEFNLRYDRYRERHFPGGVPSRELNQIWQGKLNLHHGSYGLIQEVVRRDLPGAVFPTVQNSAQTKVLRRYGDTAGASFSPYVSFRRESQAFSDGAGRDFSLAAGGGGFYAKWKRSLSAGFSTQRVRSRSLSSGREETGTDMGAVLRLNGSFIKSLQHRMDLEYDRSLRRFGERLERFAAQARADFAAGRDLGFFVVGRLERMTSSGAPSRTVSVWSGLQWDMDMSLDWAKARVVRGSVFRDVNGDGLRQKDEPGFPKVRVVLNDSYTEVTDEDGDFVFTPRRGDLSVRVETADLPGSLRLSTANPQMFEAGGGGWALDVPFGVIHNGRIGGSVYIDVNGNGRMDEGDTRLRNIVLSLDGQRSEITDREGQFLFVGVAPGSHLVQTDVMSLPPDMVMDMLSGMELEIREGETGRLDFLVRPVRSIRGTAFWDQNANGRMDPGEPGVPGVLVRAGGKARETNDHGRFSLDNLPSGPIVLEVAEEQFRTEPWRLTGPAKQSFDAPVDRPFVQRDVNIPLRKTRE